MKNSGQSFEEESGRSMFGDPTRRVMTNFMAFSVADFFPSKCSRWINSVQGLIHRLMEGFRTLDSFLDQVVEEQKAVLLKSGAGSEMKDFAGILLGL